MFIDVICASMNDIWRGTIIYHLAGSTDYTFTVCYYLFMYNFRTTVGGVYVTVDIYINMIDQVFTCRNSLFLIYVYGFDILGGMRTPLSIPHVPRLTFYRT